MLLLDTHAWWWSLSEPGNLSTTALEEIKNTKPNERAIASISIWEFAMMAAKGRIELTVPVSEWLAYATQNTGLKVIELSPEIAVDACRLPGVFHKDPADRIIVATARINKCSLLTKDRKIREYPHVNTVW